MEYSSARGSLSLSRWEREGEGANDAPRLYYEHDHAIFNPLNPINSTDLRDPFNPIDDSRPDNPLNPINRYNPNVPFAPLDGRISGNRNRGR